MSEQVNNLGRGGENKNHTIYLNKQQRHWYKDKSMWSMQSVDEHWAVVVEWILSQ